VGRFLFVVPPLEGHTNPTVALGQELAGRDHAVAWTGHPEVVAALLPPDAVFLPVADAAPAAVVEAMALRNQKGGGGILGFRSMWEDFFLPLARQMLPGVEAAVDRFGPDVLVVDEHALAGAAVAERRGLPWATSATTSADLVDPLAFVPGAASWLRSQMRDVLVEGGVDPDGAEAFDPRFSPHLVLAFTIATLLGPEASFPDHYAFVGPAVGGRPVEPPFPWDRLDLDPDFGRPLVLVTLGTVNWQAGARFFQVAVETLAGLDVQGVVVAPSGLVPDPPANVVVAERIPQLSLLGRAAAVVCHGGHNTVCESLAEGVPLVLAAVRDDQPIIADQVVKAGAGVRVKFGRITVPMLRDALDAVLTTPTYRAAARRVQASFAGAGGPAAAADRLENLMAAAGRSAGQPERGSP
jgi:MGT family glycosyltransferase